MNILQQALQAVNSLDNGGDPGQIRAPGDLPRSPLLSAPHAELYVDGRFWATVKLPANNLLLRLAQAINAEAYRRSSLLQNDTIALDAAWTHLSLHLCRPFRIPEMPL